MNQMQKLLFYASLLIVGITVLLGYNLVDEPDRGFHLRMGCLVFAEVVFCAECLVFSRSQRTASRMLPFTLGYAVVWAAYLLFTFLLGLFGGKLSMTGLLTLEAVGFAVAVVVRIAGEAGGQSIARQEEEDRKALAWRKLATLQAAETADAMMAAFPGDAEIRKAADALRDGLRHAASSTPDTTPLETKIDDTLSALAGAIAAARREDVLQLCATTAADLKKHQRLALLR